MLRFAEQSNRLLDISDIGSRNCIYCRSTFKPVNRLHCYCRVECHRTAGHAAMDNYLSVFVDDISRGVPVTEENCRAVALSLGYTNSMFDWWWAEYQYLNKCGDLKLEDLPKC